MPYAILNGYRHFYEDEGAGEPVVLLHGMANSSYYFRRIVSGVAAEFRVIAPHFRGMGFSPRVADVAPGAWQEDVLALLDLLQIDSAHFYGVSLGALIGMRLAIDKPQRVRSLTLDSPTLELVAPPNKIGTEPVNEPPPWVIAELLAMHGDDWQTVLRNCDMYLESAELTASFRIDEDAVRIAVPTLIMRGDIEDRVHPLSHAIRLHQLIPRSRLWIAPDSACLITRQWPAESLRVFSDFVLDVCDRPAPTDAPLTSQQFDLLAQVELFAGLRHSALKSLASAATSVALKAGDVVFHQGELADAFYVVASGTFGVGSTVSGSPSGINWRALAPGEFFGETGLLTNQPRSATVRCLETGELVRVDGRLFRALVRRDPTVSMAVVISLSRVAQALELVRVISPEDEMTAAEAQRLDALDRYEILDTPPESEYDEIASLATFICQTPVGLVTLIDATRQWFKARVGTDLTEVPRELSFCSDTIRLNEPRVISDLRDVPEYASHPSVTGDAGFRFYASVPLHTPEGYAVGTLCTFDVVPRELTGEQRLAMEVLARQVVKELELRRQGRLLRDMNRTLEQRVQFQLAQQEELGHARRFLSP